MVQDFRPDSTGRAVAFLLVGVPGGLGLDLCAKGLLATGAMFGVFYGLARMPLVLIWDEVPDRWVALGASVIIASGLFVVYREIGGVISKRWFSLRPRQ